MNICPFCKKDPYEYGNFGAGWERVAVTCCKPGHLLIQRGDKTMRKILTLRRSHSPRKKARAKRMLDALPF